MRVATDAQINGDRIAELAYLIRAGVMFGSAASVVLADEMKVDTADVSKVSGM